MSSVKHPSQLKWLLKPLLIFTNRQNFRLSPIDRICRQQDQCDSKIDRVSNSEEKG